MAFSGAVHAVLSQADDDTAKTASQLRGTYRKENPGASRRDDGEFYLLRVEEVPSLNATAEPGWCLASDRLGRSRLARAASQDAARPAEAGAPQRPEDARPVDCLIGAAEAVCEALADAGHFGGWDGGFQSSGCGGHGVGFSAGGFGCDLAKEFWVHTWNVVSSHAEKLCAERPREAPCQRSAVPAAAAARLAADEPAAPAATAQHADAEALPAATEVLSEELDDAIFGGLPGGAPASGCGTQPLQIMTVPVAGVITHTTWSTEEGEELASVTDSDADELASEFGWELVQRPDEIHNGAGGVDRDRGTPVA